MPSILEDPSTKIPPPSPTQTLTPRKALLKDGSPVTLYPIPNGPSSIPASLIALLHREFSEEIKAGCTYPMEEPLALDRFAEYWFGTFAVVAVLGQEGELREARDWEKECLGTFYIKPNYPGRCSHVCNAGFLTTAAARNRGVGIVMGQAYLDFAPKLGYKYSVFNLVFENNVASVKIWDRLGFTVIGRVPGAARLANSEELVDALIIGKDLV
ncbi:hypothetical protein BDV29DRAFT_34322 [Aspergillus leporis]|uniref:N-acetyltransferase domain-containing protein n=1 Tax=Aspergillus leporis TaxID=41062 RepID=A0A5N5WRN4_9EURO|nr:hypothetical protein BDV29DRAFT_34322 [Aspergillus leporis]